MEHKNTKSVGDLSEIIIFCELSKLGLTVLKPWGDNCSYDFVIDFNNKFIKAQIKTGYARTKYPGCICFNTYSLTTKNGHSYSKRYDKTMVDIILVYFPINQKIYCVDINECTSERIPLRLTPCKNNQKQKIKMAQDYELNLNCFTKLVL
jgi:hypothetical protein